MLQMQPNFKEFLNNHRVVHQQNGSNGYYKLYILNQISVELILNKFKKNIDHYIFKWHDLLKLWYEIEQ